MGGREDQIAGKAKELQGKLTRDSAKETEGQVQNTMGKLEKRAETAIDRTTGAAKASAEKRPKG